MKISENYSLKKDRVQWILTEHYTGKDKEGNDKPKERDSYHSTLEQVASYLINNNEVNDLESWIRLAMDIRDDICSLLKHSLIKASQENNDAN